MSRPDVTNSLIRRRIGKQPEKNVARRDAVRESAMLTLPTLTPKLNGIVLSKVGHVYYLNEICKFMIISYDIFLDLGISNSAKSFWLNGKLIRSGLVMLKDSKWQPHNIAKNDWIDGSAPTFDLNAERNLVIKPSQDKKFGADLGVQNTNGFICEFKKRGYML